MATSSKNTCRVILKAALISLRADPQPGSNDKSTKITDRLEARSISRCKHDVSEVSELNLLWPNDKGNQLPRDCTAIHCHGKVSHDAILITVG